MFVPSFDIQKSRYERKFLVSDMIFQNIEQQVRFHPASFSPIFQPRFINNIYLDTVSFDFFFDNVHGKSNRLKVRVRWYGNMLGIVVKPTLELKMRSGMLGNKISFPLESFTFDENFTAELLLNVFERSNLPEWTIELLKQIRPTMFNRYRRKYLMSFDKRFRLTLDNDLEYYSYNNSNRNLFGKYTSDDSIVELKYDYQHEKVASIITNLLPFRLTKSSKYVNGIELLYPGLAL